MLQERLGIRSGTRLHGFSILLDAMVSAIDPANRRQLTQVDPLLCPRCRVEMTILSGITDPVPVDATLGHLEKGGTTNPHEPRAPPAA